MFVLVSKSYKYVMYYNIESLKVVRTYTQEVNSL